MLVKFFTNITILMLKINLPINWILKKTIYKHFCGGIDLFECNETINKMYEMNVHSILDYSVEAQKDEIIFEKSCEKKIEIINSVHENNAIPFAVFKPTSIGRYDLFKKISKENKLKDKEIYEWSKVVSRFHKICKHAMKMNMKILIDAEEFEVQKAIDDLSIEMMKKYNKQNTYVFNTIQFYRWDRLDYMKNLFQKYSKSKFKLGFKLVRGAYMEKERLMAKNRNYESPICKTKIDTDKNFDSGVELMFENLEKVDFFVATHNERSNYNLID